MTRFDRFMEAALFHPEKGYYTNRISSVGTRGDFTTTPQLSPLLAKAIAKQFRESGFKNLVEIGPGTGQLAQSVWNELSFLQRRKTNLHLVEVSPPLQALQKKALPKASHHQTIQSALAQISGQAFIYSNELVDAFPVRIFRKEALDWSELFLSGSYPSLQEDWQPTDLLPSSQLFHSPFISPGQRIEVHESYSQWLAKWVPEFSGQLLTIDYTAPQPPPRHGTLRGYFRHDRLTGTNLYQNAGHIDLTADVCFDDLENWGQELGLNTRLRQSQRGFLLPLSTGSQRDQFLTDPEGTGGAFEVLLQEN